MLSLGVVDPDVQVGNELTLSGARKTAARRRPPSSATSRSRSAPSSARCPTASRRRPATTRAGAAKPPSRGSHEDARGRAPGGGKSGRRCCATRRPGRTSIRACRPNTPTGATRRRPGRRPACSSTCRSTWPTCYVEGPDATKLLVAPARSTRSRTSRRDGQAVRAVQLRRPRHRRRDPVQLGAEQVRPRRPHPGAELDPLPRADRRLRRQARARRALGGAQGPVQPQAVPLPDPGSERDEDHGEGARREAAGS